MKSVSVFRNLRKNRVNIRWECLGAQREFLDRVGADVGVQVMEDWYNRVKHNDIIRRGGYTLLSMYSFAHSKALMNIYPEHEWAEGMFNVKHHGYWASLENQRKHLDMLSCSSLSIYKYDDWYSVKHSQLLQLGGSSLLAKFGGSNISAITALFPEYEWLPWKFGGLSDDFWSVENQRRYIDYLLESKSHLGTIDYEDMYSIRATQIRNTGGDRLLALFNNSCVQLITCAVPEHHWVVWRFASLPQGFWDDKLNQQGYMRWLSGELSIKHVTDWYYVKYADISIRGGSWMLSHYASYKQAITLIINSLNLGQQLQLWEFDSVPRHSWTEHSQVQEYVDFLREKFRIVRMEDWYRVSLEQISKYVGGTSNIIRNGGLAKLLSRLYPEHPWEEKKFQQTYTRKASQRYLWVLISDIFPDTEIIEDFLHPQLLFKGTKEKMQLDIYVPAYSVAFEYQGAQHYRDVVGLFEAHTSLKCRDEEKAATCRDLGLTLIIVPYWLDLDKKWLSQAVTELRPDLLGKLRET